MEAKTDLRRYLTILLRSAWLLLVLGTVAGASAFFFSSRQTPVYQASTTILVDEAPGTAIGSEPFLTADSGRRAEVYSQLLTTAPLLEVVSQRVGLSASVEDLRRTIDIQSARDSQLIKVQVRDTDPQQAAQFVNTLVTVFTDQMHQIQASRYLSSKENLQEQMASLEQQIQQAEANLAALGDSPENEAARDRLDIALTQYREIYAGLIRSYEEVRLAEAQTTSSLIQIEPAVAPERPVSPRVLINTILAALLGLLLAVGMVFLRELLDDTVKDPEQLSRQTGLPILGLVGPTGKRNRTKPVVIDKPLSSDAEAFRAVAINLQALRIDRSLRTILVTSPAPDEGKESVAANLAAALAQLGHNVVLVDADMRRPSLHKQFGIPDQGGLSDLLAHLNGNLEQMVRSTGIRGLSLITAGEPPLNPASLVASKEMDQILKYLPEHANFVLIDAPPVTAVTDTMVLAQRVDGVLLVAQEGSTKLSSCKQSVEQLRRVGANLLGVVINDFSSGRSGYGYSYQSYGDQDQAYQTSKFGTRNRLPSTSDQEQSLDARP